MVKTMYDKVVLVFGTLFVVLMAVGGGIHLQKNEGFDLVVDLVGAGLWAGIIFATIYQKFDALKRQLVIAKHDSAMEAIETMQRTIKEAAGMRAAADAQVAADKQATMAAAEPAKNPTQVQAQTDLNLLLSLFRNAGHVKPDTVTAEMLPQFAETFHAATGRYAKLERQTDGLKVELSTAPFAESDAPEQPAAAQAPEPAKTLSKSEQRRLNSQKGRGAITDEEFKAQVAAKRKAARQRRKETQVAASAPAEDAKPEPTLKEKVEKNG